VVALIRERWREGASAYTARPAGRRADPRVA
jgi:hypothetical protein